MLFNVINNIQSGRLHLFLCWVCIFWSCQLVGNDDVYLLVFWDLSELFVFCSGRVHGYLFWMHEQIVYVWRLGNVRSDPCGDPNAGPVRGRGEIHFWFHVLNLNLITRGLEGTFAFLQVVSALLVRNSRCDVLVAVIVDSSAELVRRVKLNHS